MSKSDPYNDVKIYHFAAHMNSRGGVSPLCAKTPRRLDLKKNTWTIRKEAVTCKKCQAILVEKGHEYP